MYMHQTKTHFKVTNELILVLKVGISKKIAPKFVNLYENLQMFSIIKNYQQKSNQSNNLNHVINI